MRIARSALPLLTLLFVAPRAVGADLSGHATARGRPAPDAVVWLDAPDAPRGSEAAHAVLDQRNLTFIPHVLAVRTGTLIDFPNHDRVFHNVFSFHDGKRFDLGLYPVGETKHVRFNSIGISRIFCNIHPNMAAYVMVVDTPYFTVSDRSGRFVLHGVPQGRYTYHAWHPGAATLHGTVTVSPDRSLDVRWP